MNNRLLAMKLNEYLIKYKDEYDRNAYEFIKNNFFSYVNSNKDIDIIAQVQQAIGALPEENNRYQKFFEYLHAMYDLNGNILEIGSGYYPALSEIIDHYQTSTGKGTISAYDDKLVTKKCGNIKLYKRVFTSNISLQPYSLVTGIYTCDATVRIIESANRQNKDFSILTCGCTHFSEQMLMYIPVTLEYWQNYLYEKAKSNLDDSRTINIDYLDGIETPIISSRKKSK